MSEDDFTEAIRAIARDRFVLEAREAAGLVEPADRKAFDAHEAELIARLDRLRGTADATYLEFRTAFERGADCPDLFEIRNRMHPKDPLKEAANEDLRSVGCVSRRATRREES